MSTTAARRTLHVAAAFLLVAAMLIPLGFVLAQFWTSTGDDLRFVDEERRGVVYLQPLVRLLGAVTEAQSAATRGKQVDVAQVRAAMAAVDVVDQSEGGLLRSRQRWSQLRAQISALIARDTLEGRDAYTAYSETNDLVLGLATKIGDTSNLILDPVLDSYYLMDTVLLRLPPILVNAGRLADLSALPASNVDPVQLAVARDRIASTSEATDVSLGKVFDATPSKTLGPNLLGQLDVFRSAVNDLAPSSSLLQQSGTRQDPRALASARGQLQQATLQMAGTAFAELDALLSAREQRVDRQRLAVLVAAVLGVLVAGIVLWLRLPRPGPVVTSPAEDDDEAAPPSEDSATREEALVLQDLVDARALLQRDELLRVGRAVRSTRRERDDDSE
jgi:hypothetical protein